MPSRARLGGGCCRLPAGIRRRVDGGGAHRAAPGAGQSTTADACRRWRRQGLDQGRGAPEPAQEGGRVDDRRGDRELRRLHAGWRGRHRRGDRFARPGRAFLTRLDGRWGHSRIPGRQDAAGHRDPQGSVTTDMATRVAPMPIVAANWKMNPASADEALDLVRGILSVARGHADRVDVVICPPFPWLLPVSEVLAESGVKLGAQDCVWELSGAYTGEVSPAMLRGWCDWVIV